MLSDLRSAFRQLARSPGVLAAVFVLLAFIGFSPHRLQAVTNPAEMTAPPLAFTLKDQFDREYTQALCAGKTAIVVEADREGSKFSGRWSETIARALKAAAHPAVQWVGVATLPSVPGFLQGFIKDMFTKNPANWTLLDWGGRLAKAYRLPAKRCNVLIFGPDGCLLLRTGGREIDHAAVAAAVAAVNTSAPARSPGDPGTP